MAIFIDLDKLSVLLEPEVNMSPIDTWLPLVHVESGCLKAKFVPSLAHRTWFDMSLTGELQGN